MVHSFLNGTTYHPADIGGFTLGILGAALVSGISAHLVGYCIRHIAYPPTPEDATREVNGHTVPRDTYAESPTWKRVAIFVLLGLSGALVGWLTGGSIVSMIAAKYSFTHLTTFGAGIAAVIGAYTSMLHDHTFASF